MATELTQAAADELRQGITAICTSAGIDPSTATLIKWTMNAVYAAGDHVVRMARGDTAKLLAHRLTSVAAALAAAGTPVVKLADNVAAQPIQAGDWVATIWRRVPSVGEPQPVDLAVPLHAIHALGELPVPLPKWDIIGKCRRRIRQTAALPGDAATQFNSWSRSELQLPAERLLHILTEHADRIEQQLTMVQWHLPHGVIHGDAHSGNLILPSPASRPGPAPDTIICDLDNVGIGPREWDLVPTAHGHVRFGRSRTYHDQLAEAYGFDLLQWSGWPILRDLRELQLVTSVLDSALGRPDVARQLAHRLRSFLAGDHDAAWARYE